MTEKEKQIQNYMKNLQISREEAEQLWEDDQEDFIGEEGEAMTEKAKAVKRYEKGDKPRAKEKKERKIDENKKYLLDFLFTQRNLNGEVLYSPYRMVKLANTGRAWPGKYRKHPL